MMLPNASISFSPSSTKIFSLIQSIFIKIYQQDL
jgi:hypothetical protein